MSTNILEFPSPSTFSPPLSPDDEWDEIERLYKEVQQLLRQIGTYQCMEERAQNFLRYRFNVSTHTELTIGQMRKAIPMLKAVVVQCSKFRDRINEIEKEFNKTVVGKGAPWTPWIVRKVGRRRMHALGANPNWESLYNELRGELEVD